MQNKTLFLEIFVNYFLFGLKIFSYQHFFCKSSVKRNRRIQFILYNITRRMSKILVPSLLKETRCKRFKRCKRNKILPCEFNDDQVSFKTFIIELDKKLAKPTPQCKVMEVD